MKITAILAILLSCRGWATLKAQETSRHLKEQVGLRADLYKAQNLVTNTRWMSGTILRNVVVVGFKEGVTALQRERLYRLVKAQAVYIDAEDSSPPLYYLVIFKSHPDGCTVKQATELLSAQPEIQSADAEMVFDPATVGGFTEDVADTPLGSGRECPSGTALLR
jgi:hypothetical protein